MIGARVGKTRPCAADFTAGCSHSIKNVESFRNSSPRNSPSENGLIREYCHCQCQLSTLSGHSLWKGKSLHAPAD